MISIAQKPLIVKWLTPPCLNRQYKYPYAQQPQTTTARLLYLLVFCVKTLAYQNLAYLNCPQPLPNVLVVKLALLQRQLLGALLV